MRLRGPRERRLHFDYPLQPRNFEALRTASVTMAKVLFAAGAKKVHSLHLPPVTMESPEALAALERAPWEALRVKVVTAHQMGGCAMGGDAQTSVVDSQLRYRGLDNLFVVDGSVFPTSLGVNPQESIFGVARLASTWIVPAV